MNGHYVICGFSGVGKSTAEQLHKNVYDFESSAYSHKWSPDCFSEKNEEFPKNYIDDLEKHMGEHSNAVYLLSCHQEVRDELKARGIDYIIVMPRLEQRDEYLKRWLRRGSSVEFIKMMSARWLAMVSSCEKDMSPKIYLAEDEYINDVLPKV